MPPKDPNAVSRALDAQGAAETLRWWVDAGVDLAIDDAPHDRFDAPPASQQAAAFQRLRSHLAYLRLTAAAEALPGVLDAARDEHLPVLDALEKLLGIEADATAARKLASRLHFAALPAPWTLDDYDFSAQPGADEALIRELATLRFVGEAANVVLIGPPGVGKVVLAEPVRVVTCGFVAC